VKLFSKNFNLYDRDTSTSQRDGQTDGRSGLTVITCRGITELCVASLDSSDLSLINTATDSLMKD